MNKNNMNKRREDLTDIEEDIELLWSDVSDIEVSLVKTLLEIQIKTLYLEGCISQYRKDGLLDELDKITDISLFQNEAEVEDIMETILTRNESILQTIVAMKEDDADDDLDYDEDDIDIEDEKTRRGLENLYRAIMASPDDNIEEENNPLKDIPKSGFIAVSPSNKGIDINQALNELTNLLSLLPKEDKEEMDEEETGMLPKVYKSLNYDRVLLNNAQISYRRNANQAIYELLQRTGLTNSQKWNKLATILLVGTSKYPIISTLMKKNNINELTLRQVNIEDFIQRNSKEFNDFLEGSDDVEETLNILYDEALKVFGQLIQNQSK